MSHSRNRVVTFDISRMAEKLNRGRAVIRVKRIMENS